ncbi:MAG TPA: lipid biosynthesis B12-binding/radical SAM protein [Chitinivibrionales bacterium]|nr:lipid biosynthesis B12-binding/radical SAM protein [Chitinivibrionales bacterium]
MPSKILLISVNRCTTPYPVFPLGLAHVGAALTRAGHTVEIADCAVDAEGIGNTIKIFNPHFIGLSLRNIDDIRITNTQFFAGDLAVLAKEIRSLSKSPIIIGGSGYALYPERLLKESGADFGVKGEAEEAIAQLIAALEKKGGYENIPGLVYRNKNVIIQNAVKQCAEASVVPPLLPSNLTKFYIDKSSMLNVQTQRGCAHTCCYCTYPVIEGTAVRDKKPAAVGEELEQIKKTGARYFFIVDSVFNSSQAHVTGICEEIIKRNLNLSWGCFLRPQGLTRELTDLMAAAGLSHIEFGSDSFSDSVLSAYGKNFSFEDVFRSSEFARQARIHYAHFLIIGGPGETEDTIRESYENSKRLKKTVHFPFTGMRVYPGTPLYRRALAEHVITKDTDLLPPFFYISPYLTKDKILGLLGSFAKESKNWVIGEPPEENTKTAGKLRDRGVTGPLWEFLAR